MSHPPAASAWLVALPATIPLPPLELPTRPAGRGLIIGRSKDCDLQLPLKAEEVSRCHAELIQRHGQWGISDLASRWGTAVNGVKLTPHRLLPLADGDLIGIHPWTFRFSLRSPTASTLAGIDDDSSITRVRTVAAQTEPLQQDMLNLLLEASAAIQAAPDEPALAAALIDAVRRGTGLPHAALLRALDADGNVEPIPATAAPPTRSSLAPLRYSRSLLAAAAAGAVAEFASPHPGEASDIAQSIIQSNIRAAICAPLQLGPTIAAFLYVDSRGPSPLPATPKPNAAGFCQTLARMGALALANLKRLEVERRAAHLESELKAAAAAQRWILPRAPVRAGPFTCTGQTRPGDYLGGDFFDATLLAGNRLCVVLGDVSGHGAGASVLMTAAQGFLHAALAGHTDLARAVADLSAFIEPRRPPDKFITLWIGVFDPHQMTLQYVDAGHGYGLLLRPNAADLQRLNENGGPPIGLIENFPYAATTIALQPAERVLIISDGIVEQFSSAPAPNGKRQQFELHNVAAAVHAGDSDGLIERIFDSLYRFAGCRNLSDDATAVLVEWG